MANYVNELSGKWLEILREPSRKKTGMRVKQLLQDPGYAACQHCQYMHATR